MTRTFTFEHHFDGISRDKFEAHLNDPKLNRLLEEGLAFEERRLLETIKNKDGSTTWRFHVTVSGDLPKPIASIVKADRFSWDEVSTFKPGEHCVHWEIKPHIKTLNIKGHGVWRFFDEGNDCRRVMEGSISVGIPLLGKLVESFIINELSKNYEQEPDIQVAFFQSIA